MRSTATEQEPGNGMGREVEMGRVGFFDGRERREETVYVYRYFITYFCTRITMRIIGTIFNHIL